MNFPSGVCQTYASPPFPPPMSPAEVPVNSLLRHITPLSETLSRAADAVIRSGYFVLGPGVVEFERAFAEYCGVTHCIGVANGTDALELSLRGVGVGLGDQVAVTANAGMYGTSAILACGAEPLFVDVEAGLSNMAPEALETLLASANPKAVIVTHLYGRIARVEELAALCRAYGTSLVEDCAQAHGARRGGTFVGGFGDVASFSFYPTKNLGALGDGGAVLTRNAMIADRVRKLRQYGWTSKYTNGLAGGRNSRLDEIQARMLSVMLPMLDGWNAQRRDIANRYSSLINHPAILVPPVSGEDYVAHLYVVKSQEREALRAHLNREGIQSDVHYPLPDHHQPCHQGRYDSVSLPVTEAEAKTVLTLPCFPELYETEIQRVVDACNRF